MKGIEMVVAYEYVIDHTGLKACLGGHKYHIIKCHIMSNGTCCLVIKDEVDGVFRLKVVVL